MTKADRIALGRILKKARIDAGLSRRKMAQRLGLADFYPSSSLKTLDATIYFWEKGRYSPNSEILARYTDRLGIKISNTEIAYRKACEERKKRSTTEATFYLPGGNEKLIVKYGANGEETSKTFEVIRIQRHHLPNRSIPSINGQMTQMRKKMSAEPIKPKPTESILNPESLELRKQIGETLMMLPQLSDHQVASRYNCLPEFVRRERNFHRIQQRIPIDF